MDCEAIIDRVTATEARRMCKLPTGDISAVTDERNDYAHQIVTRILTDAGIEEDQAPGYLDAVAELETWTEPPEAVPQHRRPLGVQQMNDFDFSDAPLKKAKKKGTGRACLCAVLVPLFLAGACGVDYYLETTRAEHQREMERSEELNRQHMDQMYRRMGYSERDIREMRILQALESK